MLLFSIVIPVYNVEKYIEACVESILAQSYSQWEILLVDDGSTDGSGQICKTYASQYENIHLLTKENTGQADSRNRGVEMATGDYLVFVDSDDYIAANTLEVMYAACEKWNRPDVVLSEGMHEIFGNKLGGYHHWNCEDYPGLPGRETILKTMKTAPNWSPCGKCYRLAYWREHGFHFLSNRLSEDFELIDRVILEAGCVTMVPTFYYYRRFRENSTMTKTNKKLKRDELLNLFEWEKYYIDKGINQDAELLSAFRRVHANLFCHDILGNVYLFEGEEKKEMLTLAKKLLFLLQYGDNREVAVVRASIRCVGLKGTCFLLGMIKRWRIRKERKKHM